MLTLQRASAGSGKTYTLAKKFLWFLLTVRPEDNKPARLRKGHELADAASHILAVTFTNKATNEMKQRIVDRLAALAVACRPDNDPMATDYMKEFCSALSVTPEAVARAAQGALTALLNDYGDFHVSTIDSFFQTILRTFAYETELNDSYAVELDSKYVARIGMDAMLDEMDSPSPEEETAFWLRVIMERAVEAGENWNVFQRRTSTGAIYARLIGVIERMEKEDFKMKRTELDEWFDRHKDFRQVYNMLTERFEPSVRNAWAAMQKEAREVERFFDEHGLDLTKDGARYLDGHVRKSLSNPWTGPKDDKEDFKPFDLLKKFPFSTALKNKMDSRLVEELRSLLGRMYAARSAWLNMLADSDMKLWLLYRRNLPYMGLLRSVRTHIREFLEDNNTVELGETNSMLQRIIGKDDTPFIYERLGTRLNHFLIDEFQDTSRLQWQNLSPLLMESESRGHDNLIIGDAKQSIYRFRNADPSLITDVVPGMFPGHIAAGMSAAENTNWRSDLRIVRFNNFFFHALADILGEDMVKLYANTVQRSHHRRDEGYVRVELYKGGSSAGEDFPPHLYDMGPLVSSLRERGYRQRDIAFLVSTHSQEDLLIKALIDYNADLPGGMPPIDFISEVSLTLGASEAVRLVISALETISEGTRPEIRRGEERMRRGVADWDRIRCAFNFFAMQHPDDDPARQLESFFENPDSADPLSEMLGSMQAVALPALVEVIVERFVPASLRDAEAPYLAALQDAVADYCQTYPSDIASFIDWWNLKGRFIGISFPEETDAVRVMTIHQSKGLEFKCVILPFAEQKFTPSPQKKEWSWVRPAFSAASGLAGGNATDPLPPYLPVDTDGKLEDTPHSEEWARLQYLHRMDQMNSVYVAFTRAVKELYVYARYTADKKTGKIKDDGGVGYMLHTVCSDARDFTEGNTAEMPEPTEITVSEDGLTFSYGSPPDIIPDNSTAPVSSDNTVSQYFVNSNQSFLIYAEGDLPVAVEDEDDDPRSEGNLLHAAMADTVVAPDIPRAVRRLHVKGLVSYSQMEEMIRFLSDAVASVEQYGWFTLPSEEGGWTVANERPVISAGKRDSRPDRVLISPDGRRAVVIDYKFGEVRADNRYRRQVADYMRVLLRTGRFDSVQGWLWYVRAGVIEEVRLSHPL